MTNHSTTLALGVPQQHDYPQNKTLQQLFEQQVVNHSEQVALRCGDVQLSYQQLNEQANRMAHYIRQSYRKRHGGELQPDTMIALYLERGAAMAVAMLAIVKAGGCYVPLSTQYPQARLQFMLEDTDAAFILSDDAGYKRLSAIDAQLAERCLNVKSEQLAAQSCLNPEPIGHIDDLVYVMYTSGTTGRPKGVMTTHRGVVSLVCNNDYIDCRSSDVFLHLSDPSFDASTFEIWTPWLTGGCVGIVESDKAISADILAKALKQYKVTMLFLTRALFDNLYTQSPNLFADLRYLLVGGEILTQGLMSQLVRQSQRPEYVYNCYGPTESTTYTTVYPIDEVTQAIPIGKPINGRLVYVLNEQLEPVAVGEVGELYIAGAGLARGYLNLPELTAKTFIDNPFVDDHLKSLGYTRIYKTGDLVKWSAQGELEYVGRNDRQIKVRGYRIELEEIEQVIQAQPQVSQAAVIDHQHRGQTYLAAFVVCAPDEVSALESRLRQLLPSHMLPNSLSAIEQLPLTVNGKLDKKALPLPTFEGGAEYVAPRTPTEQALCQLWQVKLGCKQVGVNDNFFHLGGTSIDGIVLIGQIAERLGKHISPSQLYQFNTVATLAQHLSNDTDTFEPIVPVSDSTEVSGHEAALLFIDQLGHSGNAYHIEYCAKLAQGADLTVLNQALNDLIDRHTILSSGYRCDDNGVFHRIEIAQPIIIEQHQSSSDEALHQQLIEAGSRPFDLTCQLPMRVSCYHQQQARYILIVWHHVVFDGWSTEIFLNELAQCYLARVNGQSPALPELAISYSDFAYWQRQQRDKPQSKQAIEYWRSQLSGFENLSLPLDHPRPAKFDYRGDIFERQLDGQLSEQLRGLAGDCQTTLYTVMLSGFQIALAALTDQKDIVIGSPSDNREQVQTQSLIGYFVNALAIRHQLNEDDDAVTLIGRNHQLLSDAKAHQSLPFEQVVNALSVARDNACHPIFQVMFSLQDFWQSAEDLPFEHWSPPQLKNTAQFDLDLTLSAQGEQICAVFNYATALFNPSTIVGLADLYQQVLEQMVQRPRWAISQYELISEARASEQLYLWNDTDAPFDATLTLAEQFEQQVNLTPNHHALIYQTPTGEALRFTYTELNQAAEGLAQRIREQYNQAGIELKPDTLIALYMDRTPWMIIAILAVMKTGAAYVPLSPDAPKKRLQFMLEDTASALVLTRSELSAELSEKLAQHSAVKFMSVDVTEHQHTAAVTLNSQANGDSLAYVIYTSGTTGNPKGVMVNHSSLSNLITHNVDYYQMGHNEVIALLANYVFDTSVEQIFLALLGGHALLMIGEHQKLAFDDFPALFERFGVTHIDAPASLLGMMEISHLSGLRRVVSGGEATPLALVRRFAGKLINEYGPTEICVASHQFRCSEQSLNSGSVPIGRGVNNTRSYVLNDQLQLLPVGAVGELYIAGAGVARGYLNLPEQTDASFIDNPFASEQDKARGWSKIYRTGDKVRWLADGQLEYLGRRDQQVQIRGFRIELAEIELALNQIDYVEQAVVIDIDQAGQSQLAAYLIVKQDTEVSRETLMAQLASHLPDYMIPNSFIAIDKIPLTANGKLDRRALPEPISQDQYVAPRNEQEAAMCQVWQTVLGLEQVGVFDNFFSVGGNSINAIKLTAQYRNQLGVVLPLVSLFEHKTIAALAALALSKQGATLQNNIEPQNLERYPLTFAQQSMLFVEQFEQGSKAYHIPALFKLRSQCNLTDIEKALALVVERHPVLNARFGFDQNGDGYQQWLKQPLAIVQQRCADETAFESFITEQLAQPFELTQQGAMKTFVCHVDNAVYLLIIWHHIQFDEWSYDLFIKEMVDAYEQIVNHQPKGEPLAVNYGDFACWQHKQLSGANLKALTEFWRHNLTAIESLELPLDKPRPRQFDYAGCDHAFTIDPETSNRLRQLARTHQTTLHNVMLAGFYILLHKMSGQQCIVLGTPSENRELPLAQQMIGLFTNMLPLRVEISTQDNAIELIERVHQVVTQAKAHQALPFEQLVDALNVVRDPAKHPIFQVMFTLINSAQSNQGLNSAPFELHSDDKLARLYQPAKFDLSVFIDEGHPQITGHFNYALSLFEVNTVAGLAQGYLRVLQQMVNSAEQPIGQMTLLSAKQRHQLLYQWSHTGTVEAATQTLVQKFEQQVKDKPEAIALSFADLTVSYGELNTRANRLARVLRENYQQTHSQAMASDSVIALYMSRSIELIVAIIAIHKAGGAYVPISVHYPAERSNFIIQDTNAPQVLTQGQHLAALEALLDGREHQPQLLCVDDEALTEGVEADNLAQYAGVHDLAYVLYTSGTTGTPKGVMIEQGVFASFAERMSATLLDKPMVCLSMTEYTFDLFGLEFAMPLVSGGQMVLSSVETFKSDFERWAQEINYSQQTPSVWQLFIDAIDATAKLDQIQIFVGGEPCPATLFERLNQRFAKVYNGYGPTEDCVWSTYAPYSQGRESVIGKPFAGEQVYVLDERLEPVPVGAPGELYLGGYKLARGYFNRPDLTDKAFIANPFSPGHRLYKTGDLVRWLPEGDLMYLGRNDMQVKIRGHRIELSEIQDALNRLTSVAQSVVVDRQDKGQKFLAAYVVLNQGATFDVAELERALSAKLPEYMVPQSWCQIDAIPITANGKIDRRALPEPQIEHQLNYVAPRNSLEMQLCELWQQVLNVEQVGIDDNFFRLGGNSISAIRLVAACQRVLGVHLPLASLFQHQTVASLAVEIGHLEGSEVVPISHQIVPDRRYPVTFAQQSLLFIEHLEQGINAYHIPVLFKLGQDCDSEALQQALEHVVKRHPLLNARFAFDDSATSYQQWSDAALVWQNHEVADLSALKRALSETIDKPFDLSEQSALRLASFRQANDTYWLLVFHHIVFDEWSQEVFLADLAAAYRHIKDSQPMPKAPDINYGDYALWQRQMLSGETLTQLQDYWKEALGEIQALVLPLDHKRPANFDYRGDDISFCIDAKRATKLRQLAASQQTTLHNVLLSAFYLMLHRFSGQSDIIIGIPSENRDNDAVQSLVGYFTNMLAVKAHVDSKESIAHLIHDVHQMVTQAKIHQALPFDQLVDVLDISRDSAIHPVFQVTFTMVNSDNSQPYLDVLPFDLEQKLLAQADSQPAKFDLSVFIDESGETIKGYFNYAVALFERQTVERFAQGYSLAIDGILHSTTTKVAQLSLVTAQQRTQLLEQWSQTGEAESPSLTLVQRFEQQVEKNPDVTALSFRQQQLSYAELNKRANQLARVLQKQYLGYTGQTLAPDTVIALFMSRSIELIIALLAIQKAGGAYVPISIHYPPKRTQFILEDVSASIVLTEQAQLEPLARITGQMSDAPLAIAVDDSSLTHNVEGSNLPCHAEVGDLAYVLYTSGTTGTPKGVMMAQGTFGDFAQRVCDSLFEQPVVCLSMTQYTFDPFGMEYAMPLVSGGQIVLSEMETFETDFDSWGNKINFFRQTPSIWQIVLDTLGEKADLSKITVFVGGESGSAKLFEQLNARCQRVFNVYGPTEDCVWSTTALYRPGRHNVIGRPFAGEKVYVLDEHLAVVPVGAPGELYLGGNKLARGYFNRDDLTAQVFIDNPFEPNGRLYKTGDLVRWLPDGELMYLGRDDFQVKIRGQRIELAEIQNVVEHIDGVARAAVIDRQDDAEKYLAAYVVMEQGAVFDEVHLNRELNDVLPEYMVPATWTVLDAIPLTINGKLDRAKLPEPQKPMTAEYQAPRNETESILCELWQDLLSLEQVGVEDDFFRLGGNSLQSLRMVIKANQLLQSNLTIRNVFDLKTIARLADHVLNNESEKPLPLEPVKVDGRFALSYPQVGTWGIANMPGFETFYNMVQPMRIVGDLDVSVMEQTLAVIQRRQQCLRARFETEGEQVFMLIDDDTPLLIVKEDLSKLTPEAQQQGIDRIIKYEMDTPFDLLAGPLFRVQLAKLSDGYLLVLNIHHLVSDGWSINVLKQELVSIYSDLSEGKPINTEEKQIQYSDFCYWSGKWHESERYQKQIEYWHKRLAQVKAEHPFPLDFDVPWYTFGKMHYQKLSIAKPEVDKLRALGQEGGWTLYSVMMSLLHLSLSDYSGNRSQMVYSPVAARSRIELENLVGLFVNMISITSQIDTEQTIGEFVNTINDTVFEAQDNADVSMMAMMQKMDFTLPQVPSVVFNFIDMPDKKPWSLPGLQVSEIDMPFNGKKCLTGIDFYTLIENDTVEVYLGYNDALIKPESFARMSRTYERLCLAWIENPQLSINEALAPKTSSDL